MKHKSTIKPFIIGGSIFLGMFLLGLFIYKGLKTFSDKDRVVTVKGLAEMNMEAESSSITLSFSFSGDDLQGIINQSEEKKKAVLNYLKNNGFSESDVKQANIDVSDKERYYETQWQDGKDVQVKVDRYSVYQRFDIKSKDVKQTEDKASALKMGLISKGLTSTISTYYNFPELNTIKPKLIAESTKNARTAGEQFANDSQATLGKIKTASQGQISIVGQSYYYDEEQTSNAPSEPYLQKARVVSTIVFFLE